MFFFFWFTDFIFYFSTVYASKKLEIKFLKITNVLLSIVIDT